MLAGPAVRGDNSELIYSKEPVLALECIFLGSKTKEVVFKNEMEEKLRAIKNQILEVTEFA